MQGCCEGGSSGASGGCCGCPCHKMKSVLIVLFGLTFLLGNLGVIGMNIVNIAWPSLIILFGLKKMCPNFCKCCSKK